MKYGELQIIVIPDPADAAQNVIAVLDRYRCLVGVPGPYQL